MKRKRAYNVGESPRPERMRVIHTRGGYKRRVQETEGVQRDEYVGTERHIARCSTGTLIRLGGGLYTG
eukprot:scaffold106908_cov57-Phaeocystis_antarctica.AAC.1